MNSAVFFSVLLATVWVSNVNSLEKQTVDALSKSFDLRNKTNFVVYWGSTDNEGQLSDYCDDNIYDVIILAFVDAFNGDGVPLMSMDGCDGQDCSSLGSQIRSCQNKGKTIMLSIGGADGSYELKSDDFAKKVAAYLWNMFLNGTGEKRPFGDGIILDGMDFDIEKGPKSADGYWVTLINQVRALSKADPSKHYYLSGAPQCVFPDEWSVIHIRGSQRMFILLGSDPVHTRPSLRLILISYLYSSTTITVEFSPFLVRQCLVYSQKIAFFDLSFGFVKKRFPLEPGKNFNFDQWSKAVTQVNEKMKILLGIPASRDAGDGYEPSQNIKTIYDSIKNANNFAGIMMWDAADAKHNSNFGQQIREKCLS